MEIDSLLNAPRWKMLECVSIKPSSPTELAKELGTSLAYVSQQLKLLEAANLIKKERTRASLKGEARNLYSLARESLFLTALINGNPQKKMIPLAEHHKWTIQIWLLENPFLHHAIERICWGLEEEWQEIAAIFMEMTPTKAILHIFSDHKKIRQKAESLAKGMQALLEIKISSVNSVKDIRLERFHLIYDPHNYQREQMKGGEK